jgi:hypothetical protein
VETSARLSIAGPHDFGQSSFKWSLK